MKNSSQVGLFMFKPRLLSSPPVSEGHQKALKPDSLQTRPSEILGLDAYFTVHILGDFGP